MPCLLAVVLLLYTSFESRQSGNIFYYGIGKEDAIAQSERRGGEWKSRSDCCWAAAALLESLHNSHSMDAG